MSWLARQYAVWRSYNIGIPYEHAQFEPSDLRKAIGLKWYLGPGDEQLTPRDLGKVIDNCLVEYVTSQQIHLEEGPCLEEEPYGINEFKRDGRFLEDQLKDDRDLGAYADSLPVDSNLGKLRPASEVYIKVARRYVVYKRKPLDLEARRFAKVLLDEHMNEALWQLDWDINEVSRLLADRWWRYRDDELLRDSLQHSQRDALAWDTLMLICRDAAESGQIHVIPRALLEWFVPAGLEYTKRPKVPPRPATHPITHGYRLRNNEIRHTVYLLTRVGMKSTAARKEVAQAFHLGPRTISRACKEPYSTLVALVQDALRLSGAPDQELGSDPSSDSDSDSDSDSTTR